MIGIGFLLILILHFSYIYSLDQQIIYINFFRNNRLDRGSSLVEYYIDESEKSIWWWQSSCSKGRIQPKSVLIFAEMIDSKKEYDISKLRTYQQAYGEILLQMVKLDINELRFLIFHSVVDNKADVELTLEKLEKLFGQKVNSSTAVILTERDGSHFYLIQRKVQEFRELCIEVLNPTVSDNLLRGNERWSIKSDQIQNRLALIQPFIDRKVSSILLNMTQRAIELYQEKQVIKRFAQPTSMAKMNSVRLLNLTLFQRYSARQSWSMNKMLLLKYLKM